MPPYTYSRTFTESRKSPLFVLFLISAIFLGVGIYMYGFNDFSKILTQYWPYIFVFIVGSLLLIRYIPKTILTIDERGFKFIRGKFVLDTAWSEVVGIYLESSGGGMYGGGPRLPMFFIRTTKGKTKIINTDSLVDPDGKNLSYTFFLELRQLSGKKEQVGDYHTEHVLRWRIIVYTEFLVLVGGLLWFAYFHAKN